MVTARTAGISVTSGASSARKTSSSSPMMKTIDSSWIWLSVLPDLACWSTLIATAPARCTDRPAGGPSRAIARAQVLDQRGQAVAGSALADVGQHLELRGLAVGRAAEVTHLDHRRHLGQVMLELLQPRLVRRGERALVAAATTGTGVRVDPPSGAASFRACSLGALAGRKFALLPWVTLDNDGRARGTATAAMTHATSDEPPEFDREGTDAPEGRMNAHAREGTGP